jgi:ribosomal protein S4
MKFYYNYEARLDNVVFRMALLEEVLDNLFPIDTLPCDVVNIASYHLKPDKVAVRENLNH